MIMLDVGLHFHCWCSGVLRLPAQSAKVEKVFEGEDSRGAHLLTLHLHDEINLAIVLMMRNCLQGKSSNCLLYKLPTFHYVPFWNLWASSVEFQRQDPKLHYNHWAFNEIPLLIRPTGSRQFPAAGSPIESWSVAAGYSDLLPDALSTQCTTFYTKALLLKIFTKHNFIMARDL